MNQENEILVSHIRRRMRETDTNFEKSYTLTDAVIERIMTVTMEYVKDLYGQCYYCQNRKRIGFSLCRCQNHMQEDCFYFTPDIYRMMKKNHLRISFQASIGPEAKKIKYQLTIPERVEKKIIYESIRLFDLIERNNKLKRSG